MNRTETICPACGSPLAGDAIGGQCPRCLLHIALSPDELDPGEDRTGPQLRQVGHYVLGTQIGAGGMGIVYEARRIADNYRIALKLIRDINVASPMALRRFTLEAETAARLDHNNIVRIHEVGECDGQPFLAMDFIDGGSLAARIAAPPLPTQQRELALLMAKVARAVNHAHLRGVLHRDIKPANILIDESGEPHLTDFGLAKIYQHGTEEMDPAALTGSGENPGTPSYMAPEQVSRGQISVASDVYSLGAVLYALLTGRLPFQGVTPLELFKRIVEQPPEPPRSFSRSVAPDLETICLKCLEKEPAHRYVSAEALAQDLENFVHNRPIMARRAGLVQRSRQWARRYPVGAALIATLCLGLSVSLALLKIVNDQRREIQLDRDQAFDDSMQRVSQIWRDPATESVTISARELAILAGRSPADARGAKHQLVFGISADDGPSSMAQRYARLLGTFQKQMEEEIDEPLVFHLRLFKRFNRNEQALTRGDADLIVLTAAAFLRAQETDPTVTLLAHANTSREGVIFARTNAGIRSLADLHGRSVAFSDPDLSASVWAKARLAAAGIAAVQLRFSTNIVDRGQEGGHIVISTTETIQRVLGGEFDAGVTHRGPFERSRHAGLVLIDSFPETPDVLAARAGLDARLLRALGNTLRSSHAGKSWPDAKFVAANAVTNPSENELGTFREAVKQANRFEASTPLESQ